METWDEIRTAYQVAKIGTVSGAAEVLGVHHATVIRHVDALEKRLGTKLFQRHARGYTATEAGQDLFQVAQTTEDQFSQLAGRLRGRGEAVAGELVVTSVRSMSNLLVPTLVRFQAGHPELIVRYLSDARLFRLEYGEAHVAIRAGTVPDQPDNVVQPLWQLQMALYASRGYVEKHGLPTTLKELERHRFVGDDDAEARAPYLRWMRAHIPPEQINFRCTENNAMLDAINAGAGIGFVSKRHAQDYPNLVEVMPSQPEWIVPLWLVTHVDLHRTTKVQSLLKHLKAETKSWKGF